MSSYIRERYKDETYIASISHRPIPNSIDSKTSTTKPTDKELKVLSTKFDASTFWSKEKLEKTKKFSTENQLIFDEKLKKIIEDIYVFGDQEKIVRSDIAKIMQVRPKLNKYDTVLPPLLNKIIEFAKSLNNDTK